jgi:hypothetical protein
VKRLAGVGVAIALALVVSACGGTKSAVKPPPTTTPTEPATEDQWLGHYALWVTDLRVALLHQDRDSLGRCAETLAEKLGDAPAEVRKAKRILQRACERFAAGANAENENRAFKEWSQGAVLVRDANGRLSNPQATERLPLPVGTGLQEESRIEPLFTRVANDLAAPASEVRCWSRDDWPKLQKETFGRTLNLAGFASPQYKRANLAWDICDSLATIAYTDRRPIGSEQLALAFAVTTLMHEAGHLNESGDFFGAGENEPLAECWGMQHIRQAARGLGAVRAYADELAERYWTEVYPTRPAAYRTKKCRDGGAYDVRNGSSVWP